MVKKVLLQCCILIVLVTSCACTSDNSSKYERDEDSQSVICGEYEVEMISCTYDEVIGLVDCTFEIERLDGTDAGLDTSECSWGESEEYYLMPCATGQVTKDWEYDSHKYKKYITLKQVARIWMSEENKGTIEVYDNDDCVETFQLVPDEIDSATFIVDEDKTIYITKNGLCAEGEFVFDSETQLTIVYGDGSTIDVFKDGRDNYELGNWGGSSGGGSNVYTFIFHETHEKNVEKIIYDGKDYKK